MNLKRSLIRVFSANFFQLLVSLIVGFILPSILSVKGYAKLKTYTLLISYIGFFHFGFVDGLFIKYGGKEYSEIDKSILKGEHHFLLILELGLTAIFLTIGLVLKNTILVLFSLSIFPAVLNSFYKNIYQAIGEFKKYSILMYINILSTLIIDMLLVMYFKNTNYVYYCFATILSNVFSVFLFEYNFVKSLYNEKTVINSGIFNNIKSGFFILLGNIIVVLLYSIDKWFVKIFLSINDFAYYSFAVSMLNIITVLVNAISITFYNYLFSNNSPDKIAVLREKLIVLGMYSSCSFFILKMIVVLFIPKYIQSLDIISIIFAIFPYMITINSLYINLYKVKKNESKYFKVVLLVLFVSIIYNSIGIWLYKNTSSIAFATLVTMITWFIYSTKDLKMNIGIKKIYLSLIFITTLFLICSNYLSWYIGLFAYILLLSFIVMIFYRNILIETMKSVKNRKLKR